MMQNGFIKVLFFLGLFSFVPAFAVSSLPRVSQESDVDDILESYPAYLHFVVDVGREVDNANTKRLVRIYQTLRKKSPAGAARFLKGLRFEVVQKVELLGVNPDRVHSRTPEMRRFVGRYMKEWVREADEHLFRSISTQITRSE